MVTTLEADCAEFERLFADKTRAGQQKMLGQHDGLLRLRDAINDEIAAVEPKIAAGSLTSAAKDNLLKIWVRVAAMLGAVMNEIPVTLLNSCPDDELISQLAILKRERNENATRISTLETEISELNRSLDIAAKVLEATEAVSTAKLDKFSLADHERDLGRAKRNAAYLAESLARAKELLSEATARRGEIAESLESIKSAMRAA